MRVQSAHRPQLLSPGGAAALASRVRAGGGTVVLTNGVFDLLHPGHVRYLQEARAFGDTLIVAVNSDRSVRGIKGPARPINAERERAEVLLALASVDAVVIFDEETPHAIVGAIQPDVLVKGADWGPNDIIGRDIVEARGGRVVRIDLSPGHSTSQLISRIQKTARF
ncbi:MAG: D-glycero-beta-D-manno-heptose 1-phosphate adenylyltransferase [Vicinamibacterales bacterium]